MRAPRSRERGIDRRERRKRLPPLIAAELEQRLVVLVDELSDAVAEVELKPLREVVDGIEDRLGELNEHYNRCRGMLGG